VWRRPGHIDLRQSRDGQPPVPIIRVNTITSLREELEHAGGTIVVEPYTIPGVGRGCYLTDPAGVLLGLHEYDADAS